MIAYLCGGVGGSKLALGLYRVCPPDSLAIIVNTADDLELFGLHISPDLDTVTYTLAGIVNEDTGWGLTGDTFHALDMLRSYGEDTWFKLGDRDLATHLWRTRRLQSGARLSEVAQGLAQLLRVSARILPMSDDHVMTKVQTSKGWLDFQEYFVRYRHADEPLEVRLSGVAQATAGSDVMSTLQSADAVLIAPSNPIVSIGPILAVPGVRAALQGIEAPRIAVSPIVGGEAVSGPAGRLMRAQGFESSPVGVAQIYRDVIDVLVVDQVDAHRVPEIEELGITAHVTDTLMPDLMAKERLAREVLELAQTLITSREPLPGGPR